MSTAPTSLPLTIAGETRRVEVTDTFGNGDRLDSAFGIVLARIGHSGRKLWPDRVHFWKQKDGTYRANMNTNHIRLPGRIVAWNDEALAPHISQRNG